EEPQRFYRLVIGTDSQARKTNGLTEIDYVTAVVVHRQGKGARYFWKKEKKKVKQVILRDKIYTETAISLATASELVPDLRRVVSPAKYDLEIHIDVGPLGPTREMIREVVGMVNGNGYVAKTKPDSWGASSVADKHT
ncbi:ribonuclease H-like YkuK family protein, partial [Candidatus Woesebacteria bacterium]|nr:ribonuclease H-like YkuK family protein [Candidatus Woesebacteria bacterium]